MKHVTIKDVAKALNVSVSSVSRAFNDKYDIKKETKDRILKVANEMGYRPNPIAQKLMKQKSYNIGVIVPEFINDFFAKVTIGIQDVLISRGYQVLVMQSSEDIDQELNNARTLIRNFVDGLIVCPINEDVNREFYLSKLEEGIPMVFLGRVGESLPGSKVVFNDAKWSLFAAEHLIRQQMTKIYYLAGKPNLCVSRNRIKGFERALEKHGFPPENSRIIHAGLYPEDGEREMEKLIAENDIPDAILCVNDPVAVGAMKVLKRHGFNIPNDIAVVGFTESQVADLVTPTLTSVSQPSYEMGKSAAELLLKQLENGFGIPQTISFDGELNIRESSELQ
ncbi:MAG: LacI family DNA-binding transcriptional regulator [Cyclobacteriaceae bacterium]